MCAVFSAATAVTGTVINRIGGCCLDGSLAGGLVGWLADDGQCRPRGLVDKKEKLFAAAGRAVHMLLRYSLFSEQLFSI